MKLPSVRWPVPLCELVTVYYVLKYSGDCRVVTAVMLWWVVREGNVVNVQCYYRVCETATTVGLLDNGTFMVIDQSAWWRRGVYNDQKSMLPCYGVDVILPAGVVTDELDEQSRQDNVN